MFTPKTPRRFRSGQDDDPRLMLTINVGGSTDSDETDVTVMPVMSLPRPTVITLTPPARWRMALRKSPEATSRSIVTVRTVEFMAASQVWWVVRGLQKTAQDRAFQCREVGRAALAGTRDIDIDVMRDTAIFNDQNPVGQCDGFGHVMRDKDRRKSLIAPDPLQQPLHGNPRQGIERAERLVEGENAGMTDQRTRQRHALLLPAGEDGRPLTALVVKPDFGQRLLRAYLGIRRCAPTAIAVAPETSPAHPQAGFPRRSRWCRRRWSLTRRSNAAACSCRSRCGRRSRRIVLRECAGRCRAAPRCRRTIFASREWSAAAREKLPNHATAAAPAR